MVVGWTDGTVRYGGLAGEGGNLGSPLTRVTVCCCSFLFILELPENGLIHINIYKINIYIMLLNVTSTLLA